MIELFYHHPNKRWYQKSSYQSIYWGKEPTKLSPFPSSSSSTVQLQSSHDAIRPLVGILAGSNRKHHFSGNGALFKTIQQELTECGGLSYVFTPDDIYPSFIKGYLYNPFSQKWTGFRFPYPNIVYNRIPNREEERSNKVTAFFSLLKKKGIPYFNRSFFQKDHILAHLSSSEEISPYIPDTAPLSESNLRQFLQLYPSVFCKPTSGSKGRGIFKVMTAKSGFHYLDHERSHLFSNLSSLNEHISTHIQEPYIIQREIKLTTYQGEVYDFRVLLQKPFKNWQVTGIGIRAAPPNGLTTHVPKGGRILPFHKVATEKDEVRLNALAIRTAEALEEQEAMLECSLDIGKDHEGRLWIFEANAKPMRFDEPLIHQAYISSLLTSFRTYSAY
ncbi:YheC/YheD family protein [Bacillus sp. RAR_GA_16]|uniref:YheC/YheD family endospore coat-associated protein n=1 Tax=Bacillus sp. RAR_GA_16 TaxID=2876774 RepID=UPI001CCF0E04|nr:YheC/YheD family protein [Bacillus sp. RAR_GA_16]MCA0173486.1 YheC/YheD family protein [Bacillus sp. RAR_GA_16]